MSAKDCSGIRMLVAGGAGFIGSHLIDRLLVHGASVVCLDSFVTGTIDNVARWEREPRLTVIKSDVIDPLPVSLRPDVVFNLACAASPPHYQADPVHTMLTSVLGTRNLLALAAETHARFVLASTSEVYGNPLEHPQSESYWGHVNPIGPRACYDEGKRAAEALTFDFARTSHADVRVARIFNTYGPRMRADDGRVVSNVVTQALAGADITLYGDGSQTRSFCYVDDLIEALMRLASLESPPAGPINIGNPSEITVRELASRVVDMSGSRSRIVHRPLPVDDPQRRRPDISTAIDVLGWKPMVDLDTGLARTIEWFRGGQLGKRAVNGARAHSVESDLAAV